MQRRRAYANGIHALDLIRYFGGEVAEVDAARAAVAYPFPEFVRGPAPVSPPGGGQPAAAGRSAPAGGAIGRVAMDFFAPGQHRFDVATDGARLISDRPFGGVTLRVRGEPAVRFEPDADDTRYKPGFWKQDSAFLEGVRLGRQPD